MTRAGALGCAILALLSTVSLRADDAQPPALLQRVLQSQKAWRLLNPSVDLRDSEATPSDQPWPAWIVGDFDRDGHDDVAAVVVSGPRSHPRFGVVAVHAATPRIPRWITPLKASPIFGLASEPYADAVAAHYCHACDVRSWFRWGARTYEIQLFATGDRVALGDDHAHGADLYGQPLTSAKRRAHVLPCSEARVHDVAGRPGAHWYFVETTGVPRVRGWVPARVVNAARDCF